MPDLSDDTIAILGVVAVITVIGALLYLAYRAAKKGANKLAGAARSGGQYVAAHPEIITSALPLVLA